MTKFSSIPTAITHAAPDPLRDPSHVLRLYPDAVLRQVADEVDAFDSTLRDLGQDMITVMRQHHGIGLAAPQVGVSRRILVVESCIRPLLLANPVIEQGAGRQEAVEGCLSLPGRYVAVTRHTRLVVRGYDLNGRHRSYGIAGLSARVVQHEIDHLNGILICNYESDAVLAARNEP